MQETRRLRLQSVLKDELSSLISREIRDPRVPDVTITQIDVTSDGSQATIHVAILGGSHGEHSGEAPLSEIMAKRRMQNCIDGLTSASGFMRRHLASILSVKNIPVLIFKEDRGFENVFRIGELLKQISQPGESNTPAASGASSTTAKSGESSKKSD